MTTMQFIKQELCEYCDNIITPSIRRNDKSKRFCSENCYNKFTYHNGKKGEFHNQYHCRCSFCRMERNLYQRLQKIIYPTRYEQNLLKGKLRYIKSQRSFVQ